MAARTLQVRKKVFNLEMSNRLATLLDVCKVRNYSKGNKHFLRVSGLAEAITAARVWQGSAKENADLCGFVYGGLVRAHESI